MPRKVIRSKQTKCRLTTTTRLESLARDAAVSVRFQRTDDGWAWFISNNRVPLYQGCAADCYLFLQGYLRGKEDAERMNDHE